MLGLRYGGRSLACLCRRDDARDLPRRLSAVRCHRQEKGRFPDFDREHYLEGPFIRGLPADIRDAIARHGIRNSHLLAIAPTGTISLLAGNVSSGIEPVFAPDVSARCAEWQRQAGALPPDSTTPVQLWREQSGRSDGVPDALVTAAELADRGASRHAGHAASFRRQLDLEDDQRASKHDVRRFCTDLPPRLRQGPERLYRPSDPQRHATRCSVRRRGLLLGVGQQANVNSRVSLRIQIPPCDRTSTVS